MSKTYRNPPSKNFQYHPKQSWVNTSIESHDGYKQRSRERKSHLVSAYDDVHKGVYDDKWATDLNRTKKIKSREGDS